MKYFYFLFSFIVLISIKKINLNNEIYKDCPNGFYGLNCNQTCKCDKWSSSRKCSKNEGRCLECHFGHFGQDCNNICKPKCKTNLCCAIEDEKHENPKKTITSNLSILKITIYTKELNILVDYNVGYPLTIFNKAITEKDLPYPDTKKKETYIYTNYIISGQEYQNNIITIKDTKFQLKVPIVLDDQDRNDLKNIDGIIGLGFLNSINLALFEDNEIKLNIASYKLNNNEISILFGHIFDEQKDYKRLSFCEALPDLNKLNSPILKCKVDAMKSKEYDDEKAIKIEGINAQFSLNDTESTFILGNKAEYKNYIKNYYFSNEDYFIEKTINNTIFYCFKEDKMNALSNFGFIINNYYYSNQANIFFKEDKNCPTYYKRFKVEFNDNNMGIIFGKDFFENTMFTIDNEERKIYFYNSNTEYFNGKIINEIETKISRPLTPLKTSLLGVGLLLVMNIISFLIYFYFKRKKEKINYFFDKSK